MILPTVSSGLEMDAQRWYVSGASLPATEAAEREAVSPDEMERGLVPVRGVTIEEILEAFDGWLDKHAAGGMSSHQTRRAYVGDVRQHLRWLDQVELLPRTRGASFLVGEQELVEYRAYLINLPCPDCEGDADGCDRCRRTRKGCRYAATTLQRKIAAVRRFYQLAFAHGLITENPAEGLRCPPDPRARKDRIKWLPWPVICELLLLPNIHTPKGLRDRTMMALMAIHLLRNAEVHSLDLQDIDFEIGELTAHGKGRKDRQVPLREDTAELLKLWLKARDMMKVNTQAVFVTMHGSKKWPAGGRISTRGIYAVVARYMKQLGIKRPGSACHTLRHSGATQAYDVGGNLLAVSGLLGHKTVITTQVYVDIVEAHRSDPSQHLSVEGLLR